MKLTKNELRDQQKRLKQLRKYLPTLQLKKAMLQAEIYEARLEIQQCEQKFQSLYSSVLEYRSLLSEKTAIDPTKVAIISEVHKRFENIAGVEVPYFEAVTFEEVEYSLFDTPPWVDSLIAGLRTIAEAKERVTVAQEKKSALENELRLVSIRVNLFEKILIPRAMKNIKKITVFLGDQELAAVARAKVAKGKIEQRKMKLCHATSEER